MNPNRAVAAPAVNQPIPWDFARRCRDDVSAETAYDAGQAPKETVIATTINVTPEYLHAQLEREPPNLLSDNIPFCDCSGGATNATHPKPCQTRDSQGS